MVFLNTGRIAKMVKAKTAVENWVPSQAAKRTSKP